MSKEKIAVSLDASLLKLLDRKIDGSFIRSRSQAIDVFLKKGLVDHDISAGVIMLRKDHLRCAVRKIRGVELISHQIDMLASAGISDVFIITQKSSALEALRKIVAGRARILVRDIKTNVDVIRLIKSFVQGSFVVLNGDTYNDLDLTKLIKKHKETRRMATIGLVTVTAPSKFGAVNLEGDSILSFSEKQSKTQSHLVNNGIYVFEPEIFELIDPKLKSLEYDLFPKLAKIRQLTGYVSNSEFMHLGV